MSGKQSEYQKKQEEAARKQQKAAEQADRKEIIASLKRISDQHYAGEHHSKRAEQFHRLAEKLALKLERKKFWTEIATAVGIYVAAGVAIWAVLDSGKSASNQYGALIKQQLAMQGQLDQMKAANIQAQETIAAFKRLADAAQRSADAAQESAIASNQAVTQFQRIANSAQASAEAANRTVVEFHSMAGSAQATAAGQRAWVGQTNLRFDSSPTTDAPFEIVVEIVNSGKVPADRVIVGFAFKDIDGALVGEGLPILPLKNAIGENEACQNLPTQDSGLSLLPDITDIKAVKHAVPAEYARSSLIVGKLALIVQGCISYETMNATHSAKFCYLWRAPGQVYFDKDLVFSFCPVGNEPG